MLSLLLWHAGSLSLAPPQKLSSPAEFMINLPIQKSIPFLFSSYLNPVLNSTLTILEYYKKLLTMIVQLLNEIGKNIQFQRNNCYRGNKKLNLRSQWLQFITVKRIQMKSSKGRWHNVTDSKRNHVGKFQLPPCLSPGVSVAGLCTSGNVTWFGNNLIHSLKLPQFGVFVPGKMANTTTRVDLLFYKFLRLQKVVQNELIMRTIYGEYHKHSFHPAKLN